MSILGRNTKQMGMIATISLILVAGGSVGCGKATPGSGGGEGGGKTPAALKVTKDGGDFAYNKISVGNPGESSWVQDFKITSDTEQSLLIQQPFNAVAIGCSLDAIKIEATWMQLGDDGKTVERWEWSDLAQPFPAKASGEYILRIELSNIGSCQGLTMEFVVYAATPEPTSPPTEVEVPGTDPVTTPPVVTPEPPVGAQPLPTPVSPDLYMGSVPLSIGASLSVAPSGFSARHVVKDFKLTKGAARAFYFSYFAGSSNCSVSYRRKLQWVELDEQGNVATDTEVSSQSTLYVKANTAYILRVSALNAENCSSFSMDFRLEND